MRRRRPLQLSTISGALLVPLALLAGSPSGSQPTGRAAPPPSGGASSEPGRFDPTTWLSDLEDVPEFEVSSSPSRAEAKLRGLSGSILGQTPLSIPANLRGKYHLSVTKAGYANNVVQLDFQNSPGQHFPNLPVTGSESRLAWLAPPGWVEMRQGTKWRGATYLTGEAAAIGAAAWAHREAGSWAERSAALALEAGEATGIAAEELELEAEYASARSKGWAQGRTEWVALAAGLWAVNALERTALSASSRPTVDAAGNLAVSLKPLTMAAVGLRSAILPGWGQAYAGRDGAAGGYFFGGLSLLAGALLADQAYGRAVDRAADAERRYALARRVGVEEAEAAGGALAHAIDVSDRAFQARTIALAATGALWAFNVFDALYFSRGPTAWTGAARIEPLDLAGGRLGVEIRY